MHPIFKLKDTHHVVCFFSPFYSLCHLYEFYLFFSYVCNQVPTYFHFGSYKRDKTILRFDSSFVEEHLCYLIGAKNVLTSVRRFERDEQRHLLRQIAHLFNSMCMIARSAMATVQFFFSLSLI